jgi:hypothetical protein
VDCAASPVCDVIGLSPDFGACNAIERPLLMPMILPELESSNEAFPARTSRYGGYPNDGRAAKSMSIIVPRIGSKMTGAIVHI